MGLVINAIDLPHPLKYRAFFGSINEKTYDNH